MIGKLLTVFARSLEDPATAAPDALSRRKFLSGACAAMGAVYMASSIGIGEAEAASPAPHAPLHTDDVGAELVQFSDNMQPQGRRRDDPGRGRDGRRPQRMSRRDVERQCRQSRRFRDSNRHLCRQVTGRSLGRRGTCVQFGPLQICE